VAWAAPASSEGPDLARRGAVRKTRRSGACLQVYLAGSKSKQENPDAFRRFSVEGAVGLSYELTPEQTVSAGLVVEYAKLSRQFQHVGLETITVAVPLEYVRDTSDNKLNPATGTRLSLAG
jgi:translocation and assembly module TamA